MAALRQTLNYRADATIVLSGTPPETSLGSTCLNSGQHVIAHQSRRPVEGPADISVDNRQAAREAFHMPGARRLPQLGRRHLDGGDAEHLARERGFEAAAGRPGLEVGNARTGPTGYSTGFEAGRLLLGSGRPDAAFCVTDLLACGFMDAARSEFGLSVPTTSAWSASTTSSRPAGLAYNLTTFRQPIDAMAGHIMSLIEGSDGDTGDRVGFQATPVWRRSVRPR